MKEQTVVLNRRDFIVFLLTATCAYSILFPADQLNIKEILLLTTLFFAYIENKIKIPNKIFYFGLVFPIFEITYAIIRGVDFKNAISFGYVWIFLLLIPIIKKCKFNYIRVFLIATYIIALIIDFIMLTDLFGLISIDNNFVANFFLSINEIQGLGKGIVSTFGYSIFYKSCPLILATYGYFIYKKKYIISVPLLLSLLASGTRANFLIALFISAVIPIISSNNKKTRKNIILIVFLIGVCLLPIIYTKISNLNAIKKGRSDNIKINDTYRAIDELNKNPINWVFGTGVGSTFYSTRGYEMYTYEMSYVDFIRQTGIVGMSVFVTFIVLIIISIIRHKNFWILIVLLCYLAVASTNPLLITSTAFMLYLFVICSDFEKNIMINGVDV